MAHLVGAQDQEQGEGKRDALVEQPGGRKGVDPLLQGPGDDGGDHRGQEQPQVQQEARRPGGAAQGGANSASRNGSGIISGGNGLSSGLTSGPPRPSRPPSPAR